MTIKHDACHEISQPFHQWQDDIVQPHTIRYKILLKFVLNSSHHCRRVAGNPDITYVITLEVFQ